VAERALEGVRVLDLSRVLAGPSATQLLGDLGADVIKIERPGEGDETRGWGPPFVRDAEGHAHESAYYLAANRNKRSVCIDLASPDGAALVRRLALESDVLIENFKVGALARYGLAYAQLAPDAPRLVYCSITGFGQTGPRADEPGYDFVIQALSGLMSLTGEPEGRPMKVGVAVADVITGLYAAVAILAALRHRDRTGHGQHIDLALYDAQLAALVNVASSHLVSGAPPRRHGNAHPQIVPYETFDTADGAIAIAVGNDAQFARLCACLELPELARDARFAHNTGRVEHREALVSMLGAALAARSTAHWEETLRAANVPCGAVRSVPEAFADPQVEARGMLVRVPHPHAGSIELVASPLHLSATPVDVRRAPPALGQHTREVLRERLGLDDEALAELAVRKVIAP
jgi:crotonobetainyl-CoA:carnitine CoA-transferase CaiB-like acyl-CoA transferase